VTRARYLAIIAKSDDHDREHVVRVSETAREAFETPSICVAERLTLVTNGEIITSDATGFTLAIVGSLFDEPGCPALKTMSVGAQYAICSTEGAWLCDKYWGQYVGFLADPLKGSVHVFRDPSAGLPCYYVDRDDLIFVASDIDILFRCGLLERRINWNYITRHLLANQLRPESTGLVGLTELLAGLRLSSRATGVTIDQLWSPWVSAAREMQILDPAEAVERLRETVTACVRSLADEFQHILVNVSGGLDSSIVAACLAAAGKSFTLLTLSTDEPAGDERGYARLIADAVDAQLVELSERTDLVDLTRCAGEHIPRPIARAFAQSADRSNVEVAERLGADAFFGGAGGDNVFCFLQSAAPIADRLLMEGILPAWSTARDIANLAEADVQTAFFRGMRRAWWRKPGFRWRLDTSFLSERALEYTALARNHLWLDAPPRALPGKAGHIASLMNIHNHLEGFTRESARSVIAPLLAQPIIELCLQIPSWQWCKGGRDRVVARQAFASMLPNAIVDRRLKGTPDGMIVRLFDENRQLILDMLTDGELARHGLLDINAIATAIGSPGPPIGLDFFRIMALLDVEMWLRSMRELV